MAERTEKILFQLSLDVEQLITNTQKAKATLSDLKKEQEGLNKALTDLKTKGIESGASFDNLNKQLIANRAAQQNAANSIRDYEKQLRLAVAANQAKIGSIDQLKARLSILTAEWNALSEADRNNTAQGKALAESIDLTTQELNKQEQSVGNFRRQVGNYEVASKSLKQELKESRDEATRLANQFGENSVQATRATQKVADLTEKLGDFNKRVAALNPEAKFAAFAQVAGSLAGGISAAQGAIALFGVESEETGKALLKVQAAMAFATGLNQLASLADGFKNLKIVLGLTTVAKQADTVAQVENTVAQQAGAVATTELAAAEQAATVSTTQLTVAMGVLASPLTIIVASVGAAVLLFKLLSDVQADVAIQAKFLSRELSDQLNLIDHQTKSFEDQITVFKATTDQKLEILKAEGKGEQDLLDFKEASVNRLADLQDDAIAKNRENIEILKQQSLQGNALIAATDDKSLKEKIQKEVDAADARILLLQETNRRIIAEEIKADNDIAVSEIQLEENKKLRQEKIAQLRIQAIKDERQREISAVVQSTNEQVRQLAKAESENAELIRAIRADENRKIAEINKKFDRERLDQVVALNNEELQLEKEKQDAIFNIKESEAGKDDVAQFAIRLDRIRSNFQFEIAEIDSQKSQRITKIRQEIEDKKLTVTEGEEQIALIESTADQKKLERISATGEAIITETQAFNQRKLDLIVQTRQLEEEAASPEGELQAHIDLLNAQEQADVLHASQTIAIEEDKQNQITLIRRKYDKLRETATRTSEEAQAAIVSKSLGEVASLFKKSSIAYKTFAIAQAFIDTYRAADLALATYPPPFGAIAAATSIAVGLANVAKIQEIIPGDGFKRGGYTGDGPPNEVSTTLGSKPYTYHKSEYVIPAPVLSRPDVSGLVSGFLEPIRLRGNPIYGNGFQSGGFADAQSVINNIQGGITGDGIRAIAESAAKSVMENFPRLIVHPEDMTSAQGVIAQVESRANVFGS